MPLLEPLQPPLIYLLLLAVLFIPLEILAVHTGKPVKKVVVLYVLPFLFLAAIASYGLFLASLDKPLHFSDPFGGSACTALNKGEANSIVLTVPLEVGPVCPEVMHFDKSYEFTFQPTKSGYASMPYTRSAARAGEVSALQPMGEAYVLQLFDEENNLLGTFNEGKNYFESVADEKDKVLLHADKIYRLKWELKGRPTGFRPCKTVSGKPDWQLNCFVACSADEDCKDGDDASIDSCMFPGTCHSYCKHAYGPFYATTPKNAIETLKEWPELKECA